jgi:hypothetical protein
LSLEHLFESRLFGALLEEVGVGATSRGAGPRRWSA